MALFGNLFKKKECAICGGEIGLLGNRKLADGNMCKSCAKKLSPWFEDRKEATVAQIEAQLADRAKNAEELKSFRPSKQFGDFSHIMFVEEKDGKPYRFCVAEGEDYLKDNADLILFENVSEVIIDVDDNAHLINDEEEFEDGFVPEYDYQFTWQINLMIENHPYIDSINFRLNYEQPELNLYSGSVDPNSLLEAVNDPQLKELFPKFGPLFKKYQDMANAIVRMVEQGEM